MDLGDLKERARSTDIACRGCKIGGPPRAMKLSRCPKCQRQTCYQCRAYGRELDVDGPCKECGPPLEHPPTVFFTMIDPEPVEAQPVDNLIPFPTREDEP
jgi:hypothetical protein